MSVEGMARPLNFLLTRALPVREVGARHMIVLTRSNPGRVAEFKRSKPMMELIYSKK